MALSKSKFLALGLSGLLAIGVIGGASAAMNEPGDGPKVRAAQTERRIEHPVLVSIKSIMKTCDISRAELREGYQAGQSINQILEAKGSDPAQCKADVLAKLDTRLQAAVDNGNMTPERKAELLLKADEGLTRLMAHVPTPGERPARPAAE